MKLIMNRYFIPLFLKEEIKEYRELVIKYIKIRDDDTSGNESSFTILF
jgi:hypothetical protein